MSSYVLDASALLALLGQEPGATRVAEALAEGAAVSAVNLSEVVAKLGEAGLPEAVIHEALDPLECEVVPFDAGLAYRAGALRTPTRRLGLSLGDRACLALAERLSLPALTADRSWEALGLDARVEAIPQGARVWPHGHQGKCGEG